MTGDQGRRLRALGLMSGTSMDGIDVALIDTDGFAFVERGPARSYPYEASFRRRLVAGLETAKAMTSRDERPGDLAALEADLTDLHAEAVRRFCRETGVDPESVDCIGFHGQTVLHRPEAGLTVQLGDGARLAEATGRTVVYDMRASDMEAGGQGAPLAPAYHAALAGRMPDARWPIAFVNIGGIANITVLAQGRDPVAFDTGPGNAMLDQWLEREAGIPFDQGGAIASEGRIVAALAERYLASDFFARPAPKSLDRFDFPVPDRAAGELSDVARTLAYVSAQGIARAAEHCSEMPATWVVAGGGRHHRVIMADLAEAVGENGVVMAAEKAGFDGDAMEAEAWAYLAVRALANAPLTWSTTTGCDAPTMGGVVARAPARAKP